MRTPSRIRNIKKKPHRCKVNKSKYSSKSIVMGDRNFNISRSNLENINEVLRAHKLRQAEGKGSWKLVPKDSCEVYKDRRKRQTEKRTREEDDEDFFNNSNKTRSHRKPEHKQRKNVPKKTNTAPGKSKQRTLQDSSQSSKTSTYYSSTTSYTSVSDMEYDDG